MSEHPKGENLGQSIFFSASLFAGGKKIFTRFFNQERASIFLKIDINLDIIKRPQILHYQLKDLKEVLKDHGYSQEE